jgi:Calcium binding
MAKTNRDHVREERIHNEAVVDAYGPEEQALGWYYYLENKIGFPFQARCTVTKAASPLRKGETVEVRRLAPEHACSTDMLVQIRWHGRTIAVPLSQLAGVKVDESTAEAVGDWHYWVAQGYCF